MGIRVWSTKDDSVCFSPVGFGVSPSSEQTQIRSNRSDWVNNIIFEERSID